ncbi:hypothetical protein [Schlegelella aquatica]|uniref:hypothetical protein n=1 Tax=Caldimonas aquatica TaxID=376175 RepID=UPI00375310DC
MRTVTFIDRPAKAAPAPEGRATHSAALRFIVHRDVDDESHRRACRRLLELAEQVPTVTDPQDGGVAELERMREHGGY